VEETEVEIVEEIEVGTEVVMGEIEGGEEVAVVVVLVPKNFQSQKQQYNLIVLREYIL
jgi:hypothetical protein